MSLVVSRTVKQVNFIQRKQYCDWKILFVNKRRAEMEDDVGDDVTEKKETKKYQFLSLKTKIEILNKLNDGVKPVRISKEYGIAMSTISRLKKCKTSLREAMSMYQNNSERRSLRGTFHPKMEMALHKWYLEQIEMDCPVTSSKLRLKARELNKQIRENDLEFRASPGWMDKFKKRYGIRLKNARGERQTTDNNLAFDYEDNDNNNIDNDNIDNDTVDPPHTMTHVEIKTEVDKDFLYEPQFITIEDGDEPNMTDKNEVINKTRDCTKVMRCVDEVIQWSVDNHIESLYLTMLRSLRQRIRYQSKC